MLISPQARLSYLAISAIVRRSIRTQARVAAAHDAPSHPRRRGLSTTSRCLQDGTYRPTDFSHQSFTHGFSNFYDADAPTKGPLADSSNIGAPRITPRTLKDHLDAFVVGQDRAKRMLATAVYNHYQRIQELQRRDEEEEERLAQEQRRAASELRRHPVEGKEEELRDGIRVPSLTVRGREEEYLGQQATVDMSPPPGSGKEEEDWAAAAPFRHEQARQQRGGGRGREYTAEALRDDSPLMIEKSNVMLLGPSGVGKTLMAKTLARVLEVPFSMSDCTPFTQAGYIGEDAEVCVQRLLAAANYDVARAERGIICLDEIDKIATAKVSHGKDVSGEGVQQALLKIIEGTTLQIQAKQERGSTTGSDRRHGSSGAYGSPTNSPLSGGSMSGGQSGMGSSGGGGGGQKGEVYNVRTDNILFICAGAFNGLHKLILDRISKGSFGFGATVRAPPGSNAATESGEQQHETVLEGDEALFAKHLPYFQSEPSSEPQQPGRKPKRRLNTLDLVEPQDLQKYGLIPELVGRIPLSVALSSLDIEALVKVLTEPRNSLLQQYKQLFALSSIKLRVTSPALRVIAQTASKMGTGARGLRTVMERLLADAMFECPGSGVMYVLVTEAVAEHKSGALYFGRGESERFQEVWGREEEAWEERGESEVERRAGWNTRGGAPRTFEEYRVKAAAGGF